MCAFYAAVRIPLLAGPVDRVPGRILVESFPPNGVVVEIMDDVCKDRVGTGRCQCVGVGFRVGSGCDAEESILRIDGPQPSVFTDTEPGDVVSDAPDLVAHFRIELRRNKHGQICFSASGGEGCGKVAHLSLGVFDAEDKHMLCHPALIAPEVGSDTQGKAFLAQQDISAVTGVYGTDGVILREVYDVTIFLVDIGFRMEPFYKVGAVTQFFIDLGADTGHDHHIQNDINRIGELDSVLCKG